jgi:hypothetical protein
MDKPKLKTQVINVYIGVGTPTTIYSFSAELKWYCTHIRSISAYTKGSSGNVTFVDVPLYSALTVGDEEIFPSGFNLGLIHPVAGKSANLQKVNIPINNGAVIKGSIVKPIGAYYLTIVLTLQEE